MKPSLFLTLLLASASTALADPAPPAKPAKPAPDAPAKAPAKPGVSTAKVVDLRVESQTNPTAVNTPLPRFSWRIETKERGWLQKSYHILVASTPELLAQDKGNLWDSGKVASRRTQFVPFLGTLMKSGQAFIWKVRSTSAAGVLSSWSSPATSTIHLQGPSVGPNEVPLFPIDAPRLSSFECSDPNLNKIYSLAANRLHEITSQRDIGIAMRAAAYHINLLPQANRWVDRLNHNINPLGYYPANLPSDGTYGATQSDAGIWGIYSLWWMTGDSSFYHRNFGTMRRYLFARKAIERLEANQPFGELPPDTFPKDDPTPRNFIDSTTQGLNLRLLLDMGRFTSQDPYELYTLKQYSESLPPSFARSELQSDGNLKHKSPTAALLALRSGLLTTDDQKNNCLANLLEHVSSNDETPWLAESPFIAQNLLPVLCWSGRLPLALDIIRKQNPEDLPPVNLACCSDWLISMIAGIGTTEPGFRAIFLKPHIPKRDILEFSKAHYSSPHGAILSHWYYNEEGLQFHVTIPPNSHAHIELPVGIDQIITESGTAIETTQGLYDFRRRDNHRASFRIGSGSYQFSISE